MAEFALSKSLIAAKKKCHHPQQYCYALFVLFCFWAGAQMLSMLVHAPGVSEHLIPSRDNSSPLN